MATNIEQTGPQRLKGVRNSDLYPDGGKALREVIAVGQAVRNRQFSDLWGQKGTYSTDTLPVRRDSHYDNKVSINNYTPQAIHEERAANQGWLDTLGMGLARFLGTTATTVSNTFIGLPTGIFTAINEKRFSGIWDNAVSQKMDEFSNAIREATPIYDTYEQENAPWLSLTHLTSGSFWGETLDNFGFMAGAAITGGGFAGLLGKLGKVGKIAEFFAKHSKLERALQTTMTSIYSAAGEGLQEAMQTKNQFIDTHLGDLTNSINKQKEEAKAIYEANRGNFKKDANGNLYDPAYLEYQNTLKSLDNKYALGKAEIEKEARMAGNRDFALNIPILTIGNLITLGKSFSRAYQAAKNVEQSTTKAMGASLIRAANRANGNIETAGRAIARGEKADLGYKAGSRLPLPRVRAGLRSPISEGLEEMNQQWASSGSMEYYNRDDPNDYWRAKLNNDGKKNAISTIDAITRGFADSYGDYDQWEQFFVGALTGAMSHPRPQNDKTKKWYDPRRWMTFEGGTIGDILDYNKKIKQAKINTSALNEELNSDQFSDRLRNHIMSLSAMAEEQKKSNEALSNDDKKGYKDAQDKWFTHLIELYHNAGKVDDLKDLIKATTNNLSSDDIDSIISNTTQKISKEEIQKQKDAAQESINNIDAQMDVIRQDIDRLKKRQQSASTEEVDEISENLKQANNIIDQLTLEKERQQKIVDREVRDYYIGPYVDDKNNPIKDEATGNTMQGDALKQRLLKNTESMLKQVDSYEQAISDVQRMTRGLLSTEQESYLAYLKHLGGRKIDRANSILADVKKSLPSKLNIVTDKSAEEVQAELGLSEIQAYKNDKTPAGNVTIDLSNINADTFARVFPVLLSPSIKEKMSPDEINAAIKKASERTASIDKQIGDNISGITSLDRERKRHDITKNINDALSLFQEANEFYSTLQEYMANPEKVNEDKEKAQNKENLDNATSKTQGKKAGEIAQAVEDGEISSDEFEGLLRGTENDEEQEIPEEDAVALREAEKILKYKERIFAKIDARTDLKDDQKEALKAIFNNYAFGIDNTNDLLNPKSYDASWYEGGLEYEFSPAEDQRLKELDAEKNELNKDENSRINNADRLAEIDDEEKTIYLSNREKLNNKLDGIMGEILQEVKKEDDASSKMPTGSSQNPQVKEQTPTGKDSVSAPSAINTEAAVKEEAAHSESRRLARIIYDFIHNNHINLLEENGLTRLQDIDGIWDIIGELIKEFSIENKNIEIRRIRLQDETIVNILNATMGSTVNDSSELLEKIADYIEQDIRMNIGLSPKTTSNINLMNSAWKYVSENITSDNYTINDIFEKLKDFYEKEGVPITDKELLFQASIIDFYDFDEETGGVAAFSYFYREQTTELFKKNLSKLHLHVPNNSTLLEIINDASTLANNQNLDKEEVDSLIAAVNELLGKYKLDGEEEGYYLPQKVLISTILLEAAELGFPNDDVLISTAETQSKEKQIQDPPVPTVIPTEEEIAEQEEPQTFVLSGGQTYLQPATSQYPFSNSSKDSEGNWRKTGYYKIIEEKAKKETDLAKKKQLEQKAKILKALYTYLQDKGVFAITNNGDLTELLKESGNKVYFAVSKELSKKIKDESGVDVTVPLLIVEKKDGTKVVIGDLTNSYDIENNPSLKGTAKDAIVSKLKDAVSKSSEESTDDLIFLQNKDGERVSTTVRTFLIGRPDYTNQKAEERPTLNTIANGQKFLLGVMSRSRKDSKTKVVVDSTKVSVDTTELENSVLLPRIQTPGQPYLLIKTNSSEQGRGYITVPIVMPLYSKDSKSHLANHIKSKLQEFVDIGYSKIQSEDCLEYKDILLQFLNLDTLYIGNNPQGSGIYVVMKNRNSNKKVVLKYDNENNFNKNFIEDLTSIWSGTNEKFKEFGQVSYNVDIKLMNTNAKVDGVVYNESIGEVARTNLEIGALHSVCDFPIMNPLKIDNDGNLVEDVDAFSRPKGKQKKEESSAEFWEGLTSNGPTIKYNGRTWPAVDGAAYGKSGYYVTLATKKTKRGGDTLTLLYKVQDDDVVMEDYGFVIENPETATKLYMELYPNQYKEGDKVTILTRGEYTIKNGKLVLKSDEKSEKEIIQTLAKESKATQLVDDGNGNSHYEVSDNKDVPRVHTILGDNWKGKRNVKSERNGRRAVKAGDEADNILRQVLAGVSKEKIKYNKNFVSDEAFSEIVKRGEQLKQLFYQRGEKVINISQNPDKNRIRISAEFNTSKGIVPVAGEVDLITMDGNGNLHLYDFKTSKKSFDSSYFNNGGKHTKMSQKEYYTLQLNMYTKILEKILPGHKVVTLELIPLQVKFNSTDAYADESKNRLTGVESRNLSHLTIQCEKWNNDEELNKLLEEFAEKNPTKIKKPSNESTVITLDDVKAKNEKLHDAITRKNAHSAVFDVLSEEQKERLINNKMSVPNWKKFITKVNTVIKGKDSEIEKNKEKIKELFDEQFPESKDKKAKKSSITPQNRNDEVWDRDKELARVRKMLPQLSESDRIVIVDSLSRVVENETAWGSYLNGVITLYRNTIRGTSYHEAFHYVVDGLLTTREKENMFKLAKQQYGDLSRDELEERLADGFKEYCIMKEDASVGQKLINFFKELWSYITALFKSRDSITNIYKNIYQGKYAQRMEHISKDSVDSKYSTIDRNTRQQRIVKLQEAINFLKEQGEALIFRYGGQHYTTVTYSEQAEKLTDIARELNSRYAIDLPGSKNRVFLFKRVRNPYTKNYKVVTRLNELIKMKNKEETIYNKLLETGSDHMMNQKPSYNRRGLTLSWDRLSAEQQMALMDNGITKEMYSKGNKEQYLMCSI